MSVFDPEDFMNSTISEPNATKVESVPPGEYRAVIEEAKPPRVTSGKDGTEYCFMDVVWSIDDDQLKERLGREKLLVRQGLMLDLTADKKLDMGKGKNVGLGRLREALGLNSGPFNPRQLTGAGPALIAVEQQKNNPEYTQVAKVGRIS
jgi:hypothetical protein